MASGEHNSGNDARYATDAALAMTRDTSLPRIAERLLLRQARDDARYQLAVHPTRREGRHSLHEAWRAANEASIRYKKGSLGPRLSLPEREPAALRSKPA